VTSHPFLGEAHALGARYDVAQQLGDLDLERVHERKGDAQLELRADGIVDLGVAVAEHERDLSPCSCPGIRSRRRRTR